MGVFSDKLENEVRLEYMRPEQVDKAKKKLPAIYVPFGSIEWHGYHNPVGLDAIKAHEQLIGLAMRCGGVVYPAVFFGSGGGHLEYPSTHMVSKEPMIQIVADLLQRFEDDGYQKCVLLSGHYPNRNQYLDAAVERLRQLGGRMEVLSIVENQAPHVGGDHAAKYETSYMLYLHPETVDPARLKAPPQDDIGGPEERKNWMEDKYKDHPCYGLVGIDPRDHASAKVGLENTDLLIQHLTRWLRGEA